MKKIIICLLTGFALLSCVNSKIEKEIESLENRLQALEKQVDVLNGNIEALSALLNATTINSVSEAAGVYTITLSNGQVITLNQGTVGVGNAPIMSVDAEGYWMVDYGQGAQYLLVGGEKVKAVGENGVTPVVGVDSEGYWTVSYAGSTPTRVLDSEGNPVKAIPDEGVSDVFFENVVYNEAEGTLVVTLRNGSRQVVVPVVKDFLCSIKGVTGIQIFEPSQTKPYQVEIIGAATTLVTAPQGWKAVLDEGLLKVTAPAAATKATLADSSTDVAIIAVSPSGYTAIAKMQVQLDGSAVVVTPSASVSLVGATETSLSFKVITSDVSSWKYQLLASSAEAPSVVELSENGVEGSSEDVVVEELSSSAEYTLYVLPINGKTYGTIVSCSGRTLAKSFGSLYEEYVAEGKITIAGKELTQEVMGAGVHVTKDSTILASTGIYFVDEGATLEYSSTTGISCLAVIGNSKTARAGIKFTTQAKLNKGATEGICVLYNLDMDLTQSLDNYIVVQNANGEYGFFAVSSCVIKPRGNRPLHYNSSAARTFNYFIIENNDIVIPTTTYQQLVNVNAASTEPYRNVIFRNNIVYCQSGVATTLILFNAQKTSVETLTFENNTLVNAWGNTSFLCYTKDLQTLNVKNNIFFTDQAVTTNSGVYRTTTSTATDDTAYSGNPKAGYVGENYGYANTTGKAVQILYGGMGAARVNPDGFEKLEECVTGTENPFDGGTYNIASGVFVPGAAYAEYGARR